MNQATIESPLGPLLIVSDGDAISRIEFCSAPLTKKASDIVLKRASAQLASYFAGTLEQFDLPLRPQGTAFQQQVWQTLASIPFGSTTSYADIARSIANPKGVRAVGMANSKNPLAIVIPCHRVIGANGQLTGYAGGIDKKEWLLRHEKSWPIAHG
ncbi:methylated-DNA--[protein]-cysteine S-methyltransferase [Pseudidiomarina insulisalsae]|uniref:Methylated-DNA--protein-cysteine methyltransferase n=1 Tax=Pseudidiomarina insulisalsae TaxID=575789 RepID=A0A432YQ94_9GAMM|nr:methylated-DNA--[protein]-cysteine S-methyltransferase [Pseudidiomarina insulisalsae]RUO63553.1 cysteine methyltransferase [Pseudidiomarina insulisalsae]